MAKIGLFGIGLATYWSQFDGLLDRLTGYQKVIAGKLADFGAEIVDAGLVDSPEKALEAAGILKKNDVEIVFLYVSTYALSSTVLPVVQRLKCPIVILNIQPVAAIDYDRFNAIGDRGVMTGEWLAHCQACSVPEIANVLNRAGISYEMVTGYLGEQVVWDELQSWIGAVCVSRAMRNNRLGVLGHYYGGMLDVYTDLTKQSAVFGTHIELLEMCELKKHRDEATDADVKAKIQEFRATFEVMNACEQKEIERAARIYEDSSYQKLWKDVFFERMKSDWSLLVMPGSE